MTYGLHGLLHSFSIGDRLSASRSFTTRRDLRWLYSTIKCAWPRLYDGGMSPGASAVIACVSSCGYHQNINRIFGSQNFSLSLCGPIFYNFGTNAQARVKAWLALTSVNYHRNILISILLNQWLALNMLRATGPR